MMPRQRSSTWSWAFADRTLLRGLTTDAAVLVLGLLSPAPAATLSVDVSYRLRVTGLGRITPALTVELSSGGAIGYSVEVAADQMIPNTELLARLEGSVL